jgi:hypothetical protein
MLFAAAAQENNLLRKSGTSIHVDAACWLVLLGSIANNRYDNFRRVKPWAKAL